MNTLLGNILSFAAFFSCAFGLCMGDGRSQAQQQEGEQFVAHRGEGVKGYSLSCIRPHWPGAAGFSKRI